MVKTLADQIPFRYRSADTESGVSRATARRLADVMGVDETTVIHLALRQLAKNKLPQYEADDGPVSQALLREVRAAAPQERKGRVITSSLVAHLRGKKKARA